MTAHEATAATAASDARPGSYEVVVVVCVNAPDPCSVRATLPLLVATSRAMTIPALSGTGTALAALALLLSGLALRRRAS